MPEGLRKRPEKRKKREKTMIAPIFNLKELPPAKEATRLKTYLRAIDQPNNPIVTASRGSLFGTRMERDGFIPSRLIIQMLLLAKFGKSKSQVRRERFWGFINLGFFGGVR